MGKGWSHVGTVWVAEVDNLIWRKRFCLCRKIQQGERLKVDLKKELVCMLMLTVGRMTYISHLKTVICSVKPHMQTSISYLPFIIYFAQLSSISLVL